MAQRILRPMDYGDLLDETFDLYKKNLVLFIGIAGIIHLPASMLLYSFGSIARVLGSLLIIPFTYVVIAAATWAVSQCYLGKTTTIAESYQAILKRAVPFLLVMLASSIFIGLGFMLCVIPGVIFSFWYAFISEVFVVEGKAGVDARNRSKALAAGEWGRIAVVGLVTVAITFIAQLALTSPVTMIGTAMGVSDPSTAGGFVGMLYGVGYGLAETLVSPISVIAFVLLYYDIRIRKEGFDLELLAQDLGQAPAPAAASQERTTPQ